MPSSYDPKAPRPSRRTGVDKICIGCSKEYYVPGWLLKRKNTTKYCSYHCYWINKHDEPWNKGIKGSVIPNKTSFQPLGSHFKGTITEYKSLHIKVSRLYGKPDTCEQCHTSGLSGKMIHWANKSGNYLLDRSDWLRLCAKCHFKYDYKLRFGFDYASNIL